MDHCSKYTWGEVTMVTEIESEAFGMLVYVADNTMAGQSADENA